MGLLLGRLDRLDEALHFFQKSITIAKGRIGAFKQISVANNGLGNIYYYRGQYETALAHYREACAYYDQNWEAYYNLTLTLKALKRFKEAEFYYNIYKEKMLKPK